MQGSNEDKKLLEELKSKIDGKLSQKIDKYLTIYSSDFEKHLVQFLRAEKDINLKPDELSKKVSNKLNEYKEKRKNNPGMKR